MASEEPKPTLYDFLFIDHERIKSLYAQLFSGLLDAIDSIASDIKTTDHTTKVGVDPIAHYSLKRSKTQKEEELTRVDPHDLILRDVLGGLSELDFLCSNPAEPSPGEIILVRGEISILDFQAYPKILNMLKSFVKNDDKQEVPFPNRAERRRQTHNKQPAPPPSDDEPTGDQLAAVFDAIADIVPWSLAVVLNSGKAYYWGGLKRGNLRESAGTLTLKHGAYLQGTWHMLAICDNDGGPLKGEFTGFPDIISGLMETVHNFRETMGRPDGFIGVTPLLLFRKLLTGSQTQ